MSQITKSPCYVKHFPTGESWHVIGVNPEKDSLCVAGWPPTRAKISDCVLEEQLDRELTPAEIIYRNTYFGTDWR